MLAVITVAELVQTLQIFLRVFRFLLCTSSLLSLLLLPNLPMQRMECSSDHTLLPFSDALPSSMPCDDENPRSTSRFRIVSKMAMWWLMVTLSHTSTNLAILFRIPRIALVNARGPSDTSTFPAGETKRPKKRSRHSRKCAMAALLLPCSQRISAMLRCDRRRVMMSDSVAAFSSSPKMEARSMEHRGSESMALRCGEVLLPMLLALDAADIRVFMFPLLPMEDFVSLLLIPGPSMGEWRALLDTKSFGAVLNSVVSHCFFSRTQGHHMASSRT
mmetsp:Transcript_15954/g.53398  ORF Transcript_15954/g.53398 Transcript_15954/m.53398 type:complete len:274 (-) Transcript_15954:1276-2097(-)